MNSKILFLHGFLGKPNDWSDVIYHLTNIIYKKNNAIAEFLPINIFPNKLPFKDKKEYINILHLNKIPLEKAKIYNWDISLTKSAKHLATEIKKEKKKIHIVAYSLGARVVFELIRTFPSINKYIDSISLIGGHSGLNTENEKNTRWENDKKWAKVFTEISLEDALKDWYKQEIFYGLSDEQKKILVNERKLQSPYNVAYELLSHSLALQENCLPALQEALLNNDFSFNYITGELDEKYSLFAKNLKKTCSQINVHNIKNASHILHITHSKPLASILLNIII